MFSALSESSLGSLDLFDAGDGMSGVTNAFFDFSNNAALLAPLLVNPQPSSLTVLPTALWLPRSSSERLTNVSSVTAAAASVDKVVLGAGSVVCSLPGRY